MSKLLALLKGWSTSKGDWENINSVGGAASVTLSGSPALQIIPTINSVETSEIQLDALTTAQIVGVRAAVNPGDSVEAAQRLVDSKPDVVLIDVNETIRLTASLFTNVTIAMLANIAVVEAAYNASTKTATGTIATNTVLADYETVQVEFDFDPNDEVNVIEMSLIAYSDGTTDNNLGRFKIVGYSQ